MTREQTDAVRIPSGSGERVLVVEDSPTIAHLVAAKLRVGGYEPTIVETGEQALRAAREENPELILCDVVMPGMDGYELTRLLRRDPRTAGASIIILTALGNVMEGLDAGADDYVVKPFNDIELLARIKSVLRRNRDLRAISPLTGLPGNFRIHEEIERRIRSGEAFAVLYADIDNFKPYNDYYGFTRGDEVLRMTARLIQDVAMSGNDEGVFIGHVGGDDFIIVATADLAASIAEEIVARFDNEAPRLYEPPDAARGYIEIENRSGELQRFAPLSISIGIATSVVRAFTHYAEATAVASEMKSFTKRSPGSSWAVDRRGT
jgi:diguanylate cyclase (GGDEF)-like protein